MNYGARIKKLRKEKNITQEELAKQLYVTDKTISSWETNRTEPNFDMLIKLSQILDTNISYLVHGESSKTNQETEIKIKITEKEYHYLDSLMKNNSKFISESKHHDVYYQPKYRKFVKESGINEWLRIGIRGSKKILTYKNWHNNMNCDEYEVEIDNEENLEKIFNVLGLEKITVVDKTRRTYYYLDKYEIALDNVKELGYFIEIEVKRITKSLSEEYDGLLKTARNLHLNLNNIQYKRYPYQMIYKN